MEASEARSLKTQLGKIERKLDKVLEFIQERPEPTKAYSLKEASHLLGCSERQLRRRLENGEIASIKLGKRRLIPSESLVRYQVAQGLM